MCQHNKGDTPGVIGADASGAMHRKIGSVKGAAVFDMNPNVPLCDAVTVMMKDMRSLKSRGIEKMSCCS